MAKRFRILLNLSQSVHAPIAVDPAARTERILCLLSGMSKEAEVSPKRKAGDATDAPLPNPAPRLLHSPSPQAGEGEYYD